MERLEVKIPRFPRHSKRRVRVVVRFSDEGVARGRPVLIGLT